MNGQEMSNMQMAHSEENQIGSSKASNGGGASINIVNPVIVIATNAGGGSETKQVNAAIQPPMATHTVTVGGSAGLIYSPDSVKANKYDMVQFNFMSKNHTVTQSTFPKPCSKMPPMPGMPPPIDSGFMPNNGTGQAPMMMVQVTSTSMPMWFYCKQKKPMPHCGAGMTFSINPNQPGQGSKTQAAFKAAAIQQNGTAAMGTGAAAAALPPPPSAAAATPPAAASSTVNMGAAAVSTNAAQSPNQAGTMGAMMAQGTGQTGTGGACSCSCFCGAAAFPNPMQGVGAMGGGIPGAIPAVGAGMKFKA